MCEKVSGQFFTAFASDLWEPLEAWLCNETYHSAPKDSFFRMKCNELRESVAHYAERFRSASMAMPTAIFPEVLLNSFKGRLVQKLHDQSVLELRVSTLQ